MSIHLIIYMDERHKLLKELIKNMTRRNRNLSGPLPMKKFESVIKKNIFLQIKHLKQIINTFSKKSINLWQFLLKLEGNKTEENQEARRIMILKPERNIITKSPAPIPHR